jgi:hypothetical protein
MTDDLDLLLDRMAFADAVRSCRGESVTADEVAHVFARYAALAENDAPVVETRVLQ